VATEINVGGTRVPAELALPGGWLLRRRIGNPSLELLDPLGTCLAALKGGCGPALSVERAWRGVGRGDAAVQFWALAIGRADRAVPLTVTFTGRKRWRPNGNRASIPERAVLTPTPLGGLWAAAVPGLYVAVTCRQGSRESIRHIEPLPGRWPRLRCDEEGTA
jgi:hypothetical protein